MGSDWPRMGQIRVFFRSDFSAFGVMKSDLKKPRICPIWGQSDPLWSQTYHPCCTALSKRPVSCIFEHAFLIVLSDNYLNIFFVKSLSGPISLDYSFSCLSHKLCESHILLHFSFIILFTQVN